MEENMAEDTRVLCRNIIRKTVPADLWTGNQEFCSELLAQIKEHPLMSDPIIAALGAGQFDETQLAGAHLEFRYAFAQTFTDALLRAMFLARKLEPRLGAEGKVAARFLLQFNLLDELGFAPAAEDGHGYGGTPANAHYVKFFETLRELGIDEAQVRAYVPSDAAVACHRLIEAAGDDLEATLAILAVEETIFESFATPWASNMRQKTRVDTQQGYHSIHVEHGGELLDDNHAEDLWYVLGAALTPDKYDQVRRTTADCLDVVHRFVRSLAGF
jgi:hypothetical protein